MDSTERRLRASIAANTSWANTPDRPARTANARAGLEQKFLNQADGDPKRAASLKKAYFQRLALKSAKARRLAREASDMSASVDAELASLDGEAV